MQLSCLRGCPRPAVFMRIFPPAGRAACRRLVAWWRKILSQCHGAGLRSLYHPV